MNIAVYFVRHFHLKQIHFLTDLFKESDAQFDGILFNI